MLHSHSVCSHSCLLYSIKMIEMQQVVENVKENRYSTSTIKLIKEIIVYQSWHDGLASPRDEVNAPGLIS